MPEPDPTKHHDFISHAEELRLNMPLVIDEHEATGATIYALKQNPTNVSPAIVQISAAGPLILKEIGNDAEKKSIRTNIRVPGNDSFHIQSPREYEYPSGKEGDCLAQANILVRKLDVTGNTEFSLDSLSIDLYIKRKLINVFKSTWKSVNGWAVNIGSSAVITSLIALSTYFFGKDVASLIPYLITIFVFFSLSISVTYSWYVRDKIIRKRLLSNDAYQKLMR